MFSLVGVTSAAPRNTCSQFLGVYFWNYEGHGPGALAFELALRNIPKMVFFFVFLYYLTYTNI